MKNKFLILISLVFLVIAFLWQEIYLPKSFSGGEKVFSIEKGQGLNEIAENLEGSGIIKNKLFFTFYSLSNGDSKKLQAGKYALSASMSISEIAKKMISGDTAKTIVTIPEGFTVKEVEEKLNLELPGENLEGFLFPDTYYFPADVTGEEVVKKMRENFDKKITPEIKAEIERQGKTIFEIVTMASLIEKEVYNTPECPNCKNLVSGILWKRLRVGMPLQVDATISYITGKKTTEISINETRIDSPYNTYKYSDLPVGPICNPGIESIIAALYPEESQYWYYLSAFDGETIFSKTLEEHNIAKARYLK